MHILLPFITVNIHNCYVAMRKHEIKFKYSYDYEMQKKLHMLHDSSRFHATWFGRDNLLTSIRNLIRINGSIVSASLHSPSYSPSGKTFWHSAKQDFG